MKSTHDANKEKHEKLAIARAKKRRVRARASSIGKRIGKVVGYLTSLIAIAAASNLFLDLVDLPRSEAIEVFLGYYRDVAYFVVDNTIGEILKVFDIQLSRRQKDAIVLYSIIGSSYTWAISEIDPIEEFEFSIDFYFYIFSLVVGVLIWPIIFLYNATLILRGMNYYSENISRRFLVNLLLTIAGSVFLIFANAIANYVEIKDVNI